RTPKQLSSMTEERIDENCPIAKLGYDFRTNRLRVYGATGETRHLAGVSSNPDRSGKMAPTKFDPNLLVSVVVVRHRCKVMVEIGIVVLVISTYNTSAFTLKFVGGTKMRQSQEFDHNAGQICEAEDWPEASRDKY